MALSGDTDLKRSEPSMLLGEILDDDSAARSSSGIQPSRRRDEELGGENCFGRNVREKRGLLVIDLNVAPPEDDGLESVADEDGGNGLGSASNVSEEKVSYGGENEFNFGVVGEGCCSENRRGTQPRWLNGESVNGFSVAEEKEAERIKLLKIGADSFEERTENERRNRRWNALLEVAENSSRERVENRKRRPSREAELRSVGELHQGATRKNHTGHKRRRFSAEWNTKYEAAAAAALAPPVVARSTRGRAVAVPNKYRDSVFVTAAEFLRHNRSGKSTAAAVSARRKTR